MRAIPRIAFLLPGVGIVYRGAESFLLELVDHLRARFDITIFSRGIANEFCVQTDAYPRESPIWDIFLRNPEVRKIAEKLLLDPENFESLTFSLNLVKKMRREHFDLIIPLNGVWGTVLCRFIRKRKKIPFMTIGHGGIGTSDFLQVKQHPDVHVVLTQHALEWIVKQYPKQDVRVIPNGVNLERFNPSILPVDLPLERPIYLCAAALIPYKNICLTIKAVSALSKGSLLVLGDGPLKAELERQGMLELGPKRFLLNNTTYQEMPAHMATCDVFTLISEKGCEAFGLVYLEAMACNKPVVATDDPIRAEIVGEAGILCDGHNLDEYVRALKLAASNDFGEIPRKRAQKFSWSFIAEQYEQVINQVLGYSQV